MPSFAVSPCLPSARTYQRHTRFTCLLDAQWFLDCTAVLELAAYLAKALLGNHPFVFPGLLLSFFISSFALRKQPHSSAAFCYLFSQGRARRHIAGLLDVRIAWPQSRCCVWYTPYFWKDHVLGVSHSGSSLARQGLMPFGFSFRLCFARSRIFVLSSSVANCLYSRTSP